MSRQAIHLITAENFGDFRYWQTWKCHVCAVWFEGIAPVVKNPIGVLQVWLSDTATVPREKEDTLRERGPYVCPYAPFQNLPLSRSPSSFYTLTHPSSSEPTPPPSCSWVRQIPPPPLSNDTHHSFSPSVTMWGTVRGWILAVSLLAQFFPLHAPVRP